MYSFDDCSLGAALVAAASIKSDAEAVNFLLDEISLGKNLNEVAIGVLYEGKSLHAARIGRFVELDTLIVESLASFINIVDSDAYMSETALDFLSILRASRVGITSVVNASLLLLSTMIPSQLQASCSLESKLPSLGGVRRDLGLVTVPNEVVGEAPLRMIVVEDQVHAENLAVELEAGSWILDSVAGLLHDVLLALSRLLLVVVGRAIEEWGLVNHFSKI